MFIPYAVDAPFDHRPVVNWLVILGIILVFVLQMVTSEKQVTEKSEKAIEKPVEEVIGVPTVEEEVTEKQVEKRAVTGPMARFVLDGWGIGLFTYIWLHGGIARGVVRLIGNLIFLWPFGNAVCSKIGNKLYLLVYLGFGLLAGVIHLTLDDRVAVGACGAISGIVGMYIVLFPENSISCFFFLPRPVALSMSGYWVILFWFIFDLLETGIGGQSTTYYAHILCVGVGFGLAALMLKEKWLVMEKDEKSLLQMLSRDEREEEKEKKEEGEKEGEKGERKDLEAVDKHLEIVDKEKAEPIPVRDASRQRTAAEAGKLEDDFIRFRCECGHRIKIHRKDAGKTGRCPKCLRWMEAPRE
ncbi:MAG: rhomboid family intramembrane serine protease [Sedimentisphaerales bacterium]